MRSRRPPAMLTYVRDFTADTLDLSTEEMGAYFFLLLAAWSGVATAPPCHLPASPDSLARIARVAPRRWAKKVGPRVLPFFTTTSDGRHLYQQRQLSEYRAQLARIAAATASAHMRHRRRPAPPSSFDPEHAEN